MCVSVVHVPLEAIGAGSLPLPPLLLGAHWLARLAGQRALRTHVCLPAQGPWFMPPLPDFDVGARFPDVGLLAFMVNGSSAELSLQPQNSLTYSLRVLPEIINCFPKYFLK